MPTPIYVFMLCNSEFDAQTWRFDCWPMQKQLDNMRQSWIQGQPNFVTWFKEHALRVSNVHPDLSQLSYGYITVRRYGQYDVKGFRFSATIFEDARPLEATVIVYLVGFIFCIIDCHICQNIFGRIDIMYCRLPYVSRGALPLKTLVLYIYQPRGTMQYN
jgi:hypothetical protein